MTLWVVQPLTLLAYRALPKRRSIPIALAAHRSPIVFAASQLNAWANRRSIPEPPGHEPCGQPFRQAFNGHVPASIRRLPAPPI